MSRLKLALTYGPMALLLALSCIMGCGKKEEATPDAGPALAPEARTAMQNQQQAESAQRAAHAAQSTH
jgi:hypothetical protein